MDFIKDAVYFVPILGVIGLLTILAVYIFVSRQNPGNKKMVEIANQIREGAMTYMRRQLLYVGVFVVIIVSLLVVFLKNPNIPNFGIYTAIAFALGGITSMICGFIGMSASTRANVRTANAANQKSMPRALSIAFNGGAIMGLAVASIGLIGFGGLYLLIMKITNGNIMYLSIINGFSMGASSIALFMRVGGGIYTKSADVGADLVGKIEAGIPEDDPRNPAVIADNVGDNVGDCAGMAADLFETYAVTAVAVMLLGSLIFNGWENAILYPIIFGAVSIIASIIGSFFIRLGSKKNIMGALYKGLIASGVVAAIAFYPVTIWLMGLPGVTPAFTQMGVFI